ALLVVSMSTAGVCAAVAGRPLTGKSPAAKAGPTKCCCGTPDARCCGTSCCARPASHQPPNKAPLERGNQRGETQAWATNSAPTDCESLTGGVRSGAISSELYGLLAVPTLQSQHVRLQT